MPGVSGRAAGSADAARIRPPPGRDDGLRPQVASYSDRTRSNRRDPRVRRSRAARAAASRRSICAFAPAVAIVPRCTPLPPACSRPASGAGASLPPEAPAPRAPATHGAPSVPDPPRDRPEVAAPMPATDPQEDRPARPARPESEPCCWWSTSPRWVSRHPTAPRKPAPVLAIGAL